MKSLYVFVCASQWYRRSLSKDATFFFAPNRKAGGLKSSGSRGKFLKCRTNATSETVVLMRLRRQVPSEIEAGWRLDEGADSSSQQPAQGRHCADEKSHDLTAKGPIRYRTICVLCVFCVRLESGVTQNLLKPRVYRLRTHSPPSSGKKGHF